MLAPTRFGLGRLGVGGTGRCVWATFKPPGHGPPMKVWAKLKPPGHGPLGLFRPSGFHFGHIVLTHSRVKIRGHSSCQICGYRRALLILDMPHLLGYRVSITHMTSTCSAVRRRCLVLRRSWGFGAGACVLSTCASSGSGCSTF